MNRRPSSESAWRILSWLAFLTLLCCTTTCLWRSYDHIMGIHLDVLSDLTEKLATKAEAGVRPRPSDITEMTYPLHRARQFAHQYRGYADRNSYGLFVKFVDRYEGFVDTVDSVRGDQQRWTAAQAQLILDQATLAQASQRVREALARETD